MFESTIRLPRADYGPSFYKCVSSFFIFLPYKCFQQTGTTALQNASNQNIRDIFEKHLNSPSKQLQTATNGTTSTTSTTAAAVTATETTENTDPGNTNITYLYFHLNLAFTSHLLYLCAIVSLLVAPVSTTSRQGSPTPLTKEQEVCTFYSIMFYIYFLVYLEKQIGDSSTADFFLELFSLFYS